MEVVGTDEIFDVEERRALLSDVDEGRLHPGEDAGDRPEDDVAEGATGAESLDVELGDHAALDERDTDLPDVDVDDEKIPAHFGYVGQPPSGGGLLGATPRTNWPWRRSLGFVVARAENLPASRWAPCPRERDAPTCANGV